MKCLTLLLLGLCHRYETVEMLQNVKIAFIITSHFIVWVCQCLKM